MKGWFLNSVVVLVEVAFVQQGGVLRRLLDDESFLIIEAVADAVVRLIQHGGIEFGGGGLGISVLSSSAGTFTLGPNPAGTITTLHSTEELKDATVRLYNLQGERVRA